MGICYFASSVFAGDGAFTIRAMPRINADGSDSSDMGNIALSETIGFSNPTVKLSALPLDSMDNITYDWLPHESLDEGSGSHNGENYLAYTFYLQNCSEENEADVEVSLNIEGSSLGVDEAVRVIVYEDGKEKIYAKESANGGIESYPAGISNFLDGKTVMKRTIEKLAPKTTVRYTIVVYLEGEDPECVDKIKSGSMRIGMEFRVIGNDVYGN